MGCPLNGIWTFNVIDQWAADNGTLFGWGMDFNPNIVPGVTTFTPVIGLGSDSSFWDVTAFDEGVVLISEDGNYVDLEFQNKARNDNLVTVHCSNTNIGVEI